jgi:copper resistance protein D
MTDLLEFFSGLLDGLGLIALAVCVGGIGYLLIILRVTGSPLPGQALLTRRALTMTMVGAFTLMGIRTLRLVLKPLALGDAMSFGSLAHFLQTQVFWANAISVGLICLLAVLLWRIRRQPANRILWIMLFPILLAFFVNEGRLSHAAGRLGSETFLMITTAIHVLGAAMWAGGLAHLCLSWQTIKGDARLTTILWPTFIERFSHLGMASVGLIAVSGTYVGWRYVGDWEGLVGTGYGNLLLVKIGFFFCMLLLARINYSAGRHWQRNGSSGRLTSGVPVYIEVEMLLAVALLFAASALTALPPSIDVKHAAATSQEVWSMFSPKLPHLAGPELVMIDAPELTDLRTGEIGRKPDWSWDRLNHNVSGVIVLLIATVALLNWTGRFPWARHWPILLVAFSLIIIVFANPDHWPLGSIGLLESLQNAQVIQHWLAGGVVLGLGWFEWQARGGRIAHPLAQLVFPSLCLLGGIILLTHSHGINDLKVEFLAQSTHVVMGWLGVITGCARWMEVRLAPPYGRVAGMISILSIMAVGWILLFYIKPEHLPSL